MDEDFGLPTDVFVEIVRRLPPSSRRRIRLVCRYWRNVVDERTTEMHSRAKALVVTTASTYVVDPSAIGSCRELWTGSNAHHLYEGLIIVGTANGLLCMCDNRHPGGAITLVNPVTGESLAVPPLPLPGVGVRATYTPRWHQAYSFGYHPLTGQFKIVHVPCYFGLEPAFDAVQEFTLGEASWRNNVRCPDARCFLSAGVLSVDGVTYWIAEVTSKLISFDLADQHLTSTTMSLPLLAISSSCNLTEVNGRPGIVARIQVSAILEMTKIWVLEDQGEQQSWTQRYAVQVQFSKELFWERQQLVFAHGKYFVTRGAPDQKLGLYRHGMRKFLRIKEKDRGALVAKIRGYFEWEKKHTFVYVETMEPLSIYKLS